MYGLGRGGRGDRGAIARGSGWAQGGGQLPSLQGYDYVGSCRCGFGPNAYYRDAAGQITPASALFGGAGRFQPAQPTNKIERLTAEKADLERRLRELEARLQGNT